MKEFLTKFWKQIAAVGVALFGVFVFTQARKSEAAVATKHDSKELVDEAVQAVAPKTAEAMAAIDSLNKTQAETKETGDKDLSQIVDDYNKE